MDGYLEQKAPFTQTDRKGERATTRNGKLKNAD